MEQRHLDLLLHAYKAETNWAPEAGEPRTFLLLHGGAMQSHIDHPGWDPEWSVPNEDTIDDLREVGYLRVEPSHNKRRTFTLSMTGRELASRLHRQGHGT